MSKPKPKRGASASAAAAHIAVSGVTFSKLLNDNVFERQDRATGYDLRVVRLARLKQLEAIAAGRGGEDGGALLSHERSLLAREQRESAQIKNATARGDLVSLAAVRKRYEASLMVFRERALSHPGKMADPLSMRTREEIEPLLRAEMYEMLDELSDPTAYVADKVKRLAP
jgi:hypothetical protein